MPGLPGFDTVTRDPAPGFANNEVMILKAIMVGIGSLVAAGGGGGGGGSTPVGKQRTLPSVHVTGNGSVDAGSVGVQFTLSSDFAGTINGLPYSGATVLTWSPPPLSVPGDTYPAIPYTITAGSANIDVLI